MEIRPWYTMTLDLVVVAALLIFRPAGAKTDKPPAPPGGGKTEAAAASARVGRTWLVVVAFAALAITATAITSWRMIVYHPARLTPDGNIVGDGAVLMDVDDLNAWMNRPLPLLMGNWLGSDANLRQGNWTVILYRSACKVCQKELAEQDTRARGFKQAGRPITVAVAELPPVAPAGENAVATDSPLVRATLKNPPMWFVHTPVVIQLHNGVVTKVEFPQAEE
jgi:hypothetical protein